MGELKSYRFRKWKATQRSIEVLFSSIRTPTRNALAHAPMDASFHGMNEYELVSMFVCSLNNFFIAFGDHLKFVARTRIKERKKRGIINWTKRRNNLRGTSAVRREPKLPPYRNVCPSQCAAPNDSHRTIDTITSDDSNSNHNFNTFIFFYVAEVSSRIAS